MTLFSISSVISNDINVLNSNTFPVCLLLQRSFCSCVGAALCGPPSGRFPQPSTSLVTWASPSTTNCFSPPCSTCSGKQPRFWLKIHNNEPSAACRTNRKRMRDNLCVFCLSQVYVPFSPSWLDAAALLHTHTCDHHCDTRPALHPQGKS